MIVGIGIDILELERIKNLKDRDKFIKKYFTENERKIFDKGFTKMADNFAVKEAVSKVFGTGIRGFKLKDIEVLRDELGRPYINLYNKALKLSESLDIDKVHVSISNSENYVVAFAIGENKSR